MKDAKLQTARTLAGNPPLTTAFQTSKHPVIQTQQQELKAKPAASKVLQKAIFFSFQRNSTNMTI